MTHQSKLYPVTTIYYTTRVELSDLSISQDWDTYLWTGSIRPAKYSDYANIRTGDTAVLYLQETPYQMVIKNRSHSDNDGKTTFTIQVASPTVKLEQEK